MRQLHTVTEVEAFEDGILTRSIGLAGFAILLWDHLITLQDEVEYIWKSQRKGPVVWLFLLNRYMIPIGFIINIFAYFSHVFNYNTCSHFVVYEGCMTLFGISIAGLLMFLRIRALYHDHFYVYALVLCIWCTTVSVNSWLLTHVTPVFVDSPTIISCTMIFNPSIGSIATASAWLPLLYDFAVLALTVYPSLSVARGQKSAARDVMHELVRQGLLYYSLLVSVTFALLVMIAVADASVKNITAQLELCLTATMVSRITLDLKRFAREYTVEPHAPDRGMRLSVVNVPVTDIPLDAEGAFSGLGCATDAIAGTGDASGELGTETSFFAMVTQDESGADVDAASVDVAPDESEKKARTGATDAECVVSATTETARERDAGTVRAERTCDEWDAIKVVDRSVGV